MSSILGIDTSNYTTSVAIYDTKTKKVIQKKKLLPVKEGEKGIRQADAVFHHTQQIRELIKDIPMENILGVAVSIRPRWAEDSYMPCFTVGQTVAASVALALNVPLYEVSHQEGHVTAALYSADKLALAGKEFLAFHVSGGTTESLLVSPSNRSPVEASMIGTSSDLKAGQAVDRVGLMLGLNFPCGIELEKLALKSTKSFDIKPSMNGKDCSLSGVENKCKKMIENGEAKEDVALFCLKYIEASIKGMVSALFKTYDSLPVVFSGGVMSNSILQKGLLEYCKANDRDAYFAEPQFSSDNAVGVAILGDLICKM